VTRRRIGVAVIAAIVLVAAVTVMLLRLSSSSPSPDPSGETMPVGDLPGWHQVFTDNFAKAVPLGSFPTAVSGKWDAYTGPDTSGAGTYSPTKVISIGGGVMNMHLHTEDGKHLVAAALPIIPGHDGAYNGLTYGRYAVRFRVDQPADLAGYKTAWLLWPDSDTWADGEIDFPEGDLNNSVSAYLHHKGDPESQETYPTNATYGTWHTAVIEWTPQSVTFTLDGAKVGSNTDATILPDSPMHWVLQTETSPDGPDDAAAGNVEIDFTGVVPSRPLDPHNFSGVVPSRPVLGTNSVKLCRSCVSRGQRLEVAVNASSLGQSRVMDSPWARAIHRAETSSRR
jgi:hypothetical protein